MRVLTVSMVAALVTVGVQEPDLTLEFRDVINRPGPAVWIDLHTIDVLRGHELGVTVRVDSDVPELRMVCTADGLPDTDQIKASDGPRWMNPLACTQGYNRHWVALESAVAVKGVRAKDFDGGEVVVGHAFPNAPHGIGNAYVCTITDRGPNHRTYACNRVYRQ